MKNISDLAPRKTLLQKIKEVWNEPKPTPEEIKECAELTKLLLTN